MKEQFMSMRKSFGELSHEIGKTIHNELKVIMNDSPEIPGGIEWWSKNKDHTRKVIIQLYYDGTILLYLLQNGDGGFPDIDDSSPKVFSVLNAEGLSLAIQKIKEFLS